MTGIEKVTQELLVCVAVLAKVLLVCFYGTATESSILDARCEARMWKLDILVAGPR